MEEETKAAAEDAAPALDFTDPNALVELVTTQGIDIAIQIALAVLIFVVGRWVAQWITSIVRKALAKTEMENTLERFLCNIVYSVLLAVVIIAAIGQLGVETTSLIAIFGAAGLAVGLALQGSLSNFAAGVLI
ncbi:MAG: mechanosensitive ion channel, partial [Woeseiaceae bacterium]|nr:mechanosensitive ion channel [Woeseiaceae bacterium]